MEIPGQGVHARRLGPEVCLKNRVWAGLTKNRLTVDPTGAVVSVAREGLLDATAANSLQASQAIEGRNF
jgi:hypothetical protein